MQMGLKVSFTIILKLGNAQIIPTKLKPKFTPRVKFNRLRSVTTRKIKLKNYKIASESSNKLRSFMYLGIYHRVSILTIHQSSCSNLFVILLISMQISQNV